MGKTKNIIIFILVGTAFSAGIYFRDDAIKFYNSFNKQVQTQTQNFQKTNVNSIVSEVGKQILAPAPLNIGGNNDNQITLLQSKIISETNSQRKENGNLPALKENAELDETAAAKAADLFKNQYFEHVSPTGVDPGKLAQSYGYNYIIEGENLILGNFSSEKEVVQDWMNSKEHRANILNNRYTEIGVAIVKGTYKNETVWIGVQEFGFPLSACEDPDANLKNQIDSDNNELNTLSTQIDANKKQIDNAGQNSPAYSQMVDDYNQLIAQYNSLAETAKSLVTKYNNQVNTFNNCVLGK